MPVNDGTYGYPFHNFAMDLRGTQTPGDSTRSAIIYPRMKFTFLVEFAINPYALQNGVAQTDLNRFIRNGRLYTSLKSVGHPKMNFKVETLRSYNKFVKVPTTREHQPFRIVFHDDNTSMALALWKEYLAFYTHAGDVGRGQAIRNQPLTNQNNEFRAQNDLTGQEVRSDMDIHPSVGMVLRPYLKRNFFDSITIYDLGSEPDSVNVYTYVNPVVVGNDHTDLDYFDRTGLSEFTLNFEYEDMYFIVGQSNNRLRPVIESILGVPQSAQTPRVEGHSRMVATNPNLRAPATSLTASPGTSDPNVDDSITQTQLPRSNQGPITSSPAPQQLIGPFSGQPLPTTAQKRQELLENTQKLLDNGVSNPDLREKLLDLRADLLDQRERDNASLITPATKQATEATKKLLGN